MDGGSNRRATVSEALFPTQLPHRPPLPLACGSPARYGSLARARNLKCPRNPLFCKRFCVGPGAHKRINHLTPSTAWRNPAILVRKGPRPTPPMSPARPDSMLFGLHDSMMTAWRAAPDDRQGGVLAGARELDGKVADKG